MRKHLPILMVLAVIFAVSATVAGPRQMERPLRFGQLDTDLVSVDNPADGLRWAAWGYRNGAEFDVAIASSADGVWSEPTLIGLDDGIDQIAPSLAVAGDGAIHLVYHERTSSRIVHRRLDPVSGQWSTPEIVASRRGVASPEVQVFGDRVVVAYRVGRRVELVDFSVATGIVFGTNGVQDGPDPFGNKKDGPSPGEEDDENEPIEDDLDPSEPGYVIAIGTGSSESGR